MFYECLFVANEYEQGNSQVMSIHVMCYFISCFILLLQVVRRDRAHLTKALQQLVMGVVRAGLGVVLGLAWACVGVWGHGRLIEPPGRSTAWR